MPQILSGFYRNLPLSDVTFHENVTAAVCYYAAIRKRHVVPAGNYRSHGVIIAIVIRSLGARPRRSKLGKICPNRLET